jgi:hypothetical protein
VSRQGQRPRFEPRCRYPQRHEMHTQETQPLAVLSFPRPVQETSTQRFRRLKAISDATGVRLLFVYLREQGRDAREGL